MTTRRITMNAEQTIRWRDSSDIGLYFRRSIHRIVSLDTLGDGPCRVELVTSDGKVADAWDVTP